MTSDDLYLFNCWQLADWESLAHVNIRNKKESHLALKASAQLQLGETHAAKNTLADLPVPLSEQTVRLLISGAFNTLGKAREILWDIQRAEAHYAEAIETVLGQRNSLHVIKARALVKTEEEMKIKYRQSSKINKLYVDVVGASGSGKTTLIKYLVENYKFVSVVALSKKNKDKGGELVLEFLKNHPFFLDNIQHALEHNFLISSWFSKLIQGYMNSPESGARLITDEGFVCRVNTVFSYQKSDLIKGKVFQYLSSIPQPDLLVIKKVTPSVCFERINGRAAGLPGRMRTLSTQEKLKVIQNQILMLDWIKEFYADTVTKVLEIDEREQLEDAAKKIISVSNVELLQE